MTSVCPTTGETLAHVKSASPQELHEAIGKTREAYKTLRSEFIGIAVCSSTMFRYPL